jgi:hypothetical protein
MQLFAKTLQLFALWHSPCKGSSKQSSPHGMANDYDSGELYHVPIFRRAGLVLGSHLVYLALQRIRCQG